MPNKKTNKSDFVSKNKTNGIETLLGDPKKAIIRLSIPMIVAMIVQTFYNLIDAIWVSGLGADALAAVGFVYPFIFMAMALANGIGIGGGSAISRRIGAKDKFGADNVATHTIAIMIIASILFTIPFFIFADNIFTIIGAGNITADATIYARIIALGSIIIFFSFVANAILRAEGDAKRAMYAMALGAGLNIVLDPIFIYTFNLGVAGAAWATVLAMAIGSIIISYWLFFKKDTFVTFSFKKFKFNKSVVKDILSVGLPASVQQFSMSIMMLIMNIIVVIVGGTDGVAVYSTGWRVVTIAILPLLGIATAVVSVTGATFGAKDYKKLDTAYLYSVKIGLIIETIIAIATFALAGYITAIFTQSENAQRIADDLTNFLQIACFFYPGVAFGMLSSSMFQGTGKGLYSLIVTIFRTIILIPPVAWILSISLNMGLTGVWWGLVLANITGSIVAFIWGRIYINRIKKINQ